MQLHQLSPKHKLKKKKRIGRGGKRGTYSGKGIKGQRARAGRKFAPVIRELIKRYPKLRGYRVQNQGKEVAVINIGDLNKNFKDSEIINPEALIEKKLIERERCAEDRRVVYVRISEEGLKILSQIDEEWGKGGEEFLSTSLTEQEAELLSDLLDKLRD